MEAMRKGYLKTDFEVFYINDKKSYEFEYHFHDFHKVIIFLKGDVNYIIEGKTYKLKPYDVLFVRDCEIHKPEINPNEPYERIIVWIRNGKVFSESEDTDILNCFSHKDDRLLNLLRLGENISENIRNAISELKDCFVVGGFGANTMKKVLFIQLLIYINREVQMSANLPQAKNYAEYDITIARAIEYINGNLTGELTIEKISEMLYISKYHLMRKFKKVTGYTLHTFILKKRLFFARELINKGKSAEWACSQSGFGDYSTFVRAYKKIFNQLPVKSAKKP